MHCLASSIVVALSVLLCTIGVQGRGPCRGQKLINFSPLVGVYTPRCSPSGYFQIIQRHGSTGHSWCVNPETGVKVESSDVGPGGQPGCGKCLYELEKYHNGGVVAIGRQKPRCDDNGLFTPQQSSASSGYSRCVNPDTGDKLEGTDVGPGAGQANCGTARQKRAVGQCAQELETTANVPFLPGAYRPQCTSKGHYTLVQLHGSTGYSWCVNPVNGIEIEGTRVGPGKESSCPTCVSLLSQALEKILVGVYRPQCDADGKFKRIQISASTGMAWCANPVTGEKTSTPQRYDGTIKCDQQAAEDEPMGPCAAISILMFNPMLGVDRPTCDARGYYASIQTREGHRFCVDTNTGIQLPGSPTFAPGDNRKLPCEN